MMFKTIGRLAVRYMAHVPQRSGDSLHYFFQIQRVAGMCKPVMYDSQRRFTSVAIRCDTSEETRISANHAKHLDGCLAGLEELPLGDGPFKCPGQWRFRTDNSGDKMMQTGKVVKTR
jgi:hypothetical protein